MKRPFEVRARVVKTRTFLIDANTPEEAEAIAETWLNDGEIGVEQFESLEEIEAVPVEEGGDGDLLGGLL